MGFSSSAIKAIIGVGSASVVAIASGIGINNKKRKEHEKKLDEQVYKLKESVERNQDKTGFDEGLIKLLQESGDVIFDLFQGTKKDEDSTTLFKEDVIPSGNTWIITASIEIKDTNEKIKGKPENIEILKRLNGGKDWKWECKIQFNSLSSKSGETWNLADKEKIFSNSGDTLFSSLKKDLSKNQDSSTRERKNKFIEKCASLRRVTRSMNNQTIKTQISFTGKKITSSKEFSLFKKTTEISDEIFFREQDKPWEWFGGQKNEWKVLNVDPFGKPIS